MGKFSYIATSKRRRKGKTDYRTRKNVIISKQNLVTIRISDRNASVQIATPRIGGDNVIVAAHSGELKKMGWRGSGKSIPSVYLTGLLAGKRAGEAGVESAIVYSGIETLRAGSRLAAAVKGVIDGGVKVPVDEEVLPPKERIEGEHISKYASSTAGSETSQFSTWKQSKLSAESFGDHFGEILAKIKGGA